MELNGTFFCRKQTKNKELQKLIFNQAIDGEFISIMFLRLKEGMLLRGEEELHCNSAL